MVVIKSHAEFESHLGKEIGVSPWHQITQEQINNFADATLDHQWIHIDVERAKRESPFKTTIAHGYLTLSLIPYFWKQIADVQNLKMEVNYGIEQLKFGQACTCKQRSTVQGFSQIHHQPKRHYQSNPLYSTGNKRPAKACFYRRYFISLPFYINKLLPGNNSSVPLLLLQQVYCCGIWIQPYP
jgi:hypothetical protein